MFRRDFLTCVLASGFTALLAPTRILAQGSAPGGTGSGSRLGDGQPSRTAQSTARLRAAHQLLDQPKIFDDPLAFRIIGGQAESAVRANPHGDPYLATLRAFVALRGRYAEDELTQAVQKGVRQYVILGAGLDTFAYRNPHATSGLRVFEVDHPATQAWKRASLRGAGIKIPDSLSFAPIDFEKQTLADGLRAAGVKADEPAFFSMLGVVMYLTKDAIMGTMKLVAASPPGSGIVFDYSVPPSMLTESERRIRDVIAARVARLGEPFLTHFDPASLANELREIGFKHVEELGPTEANDRYFKDRTDGLCIGNTARLMKAGV
jgi:methyltransferase (TIGR00027 family)